MNQSKETNQNPANQCSWLTPQNILFVFFILLFFVTIVWSDQIGMWVEDLNIQESTFTPSPTSDIATITPIPIEYIQNPAEINAVIIGGAALIVIILLSTFLVFLRVK